MGWNDADPRVYFAPGCTAPLLRWANSTDGAYTSSSRCVQCGCRALGHGNRPTACGHADRGHHRRGGRDVHAGNRHQLPDLRTAARVAGNLTASLTLRGARTDSRRPERLKEHSWPPRGSDPQIRVVGTPCRAGLLSVCWESGGNLDDVGSVVCAGTDVAGCPSVGVRRERAVGA
jgi:hypothetical protein